MARIPESRPCISGFVSQLSHPLRPRHVTFFAVTVSTCSNDVVSSTFAAELDRIEVIIRQVIAGWRDAALAPTSHLHRRIAVVAVKLPAVTDEVVINGRALHRIREFAPRPVNVVYEDRGVASEHIVRVAYSRSTRRVTYDGMSLTCTFINRNRVGPRLTTWLTATVTAARTDAGARYRTSKGPARRPRDVVATLSSNARPRPRTRVYGRRERTRAAPPASRALRVALRPPYGRPLTPETTTAPQTPTPPDRHLTAPAPPPRHPTAIKPTRAPSTERRRRSGYGSELVQTCST